MKTRVLHVIDSFDLGGAQTALLNLLRAADRSRWEPAVACMHGQGVFWRAFADLGVPVHSLSPRRWLPLYLPRLAQLIAVRRPEIVHCHLFGANWIAKPLAALLRVPVRINHDQCNDALRVEQPLARRIDALTNRLSSHICAVSASTRDFLIEKEGVTPEKVSLVYNGVELPPPRPRIVTQPTVLGVGRLHSQKDFPLFLRAAGRLPRGTRICLAGTGPEEVALRALARSLALDVEFLGHVSDTRALYASASVLLMTSRFEGTPLTVLEAMAARLPIVAPQLDGIGEILTSGENALLVDGREPAAFTDAVSRLLSDAALAERLADAAERTVRARYSAETMARAVEAIYERCLRSTRPAATPRG